MKPSVFYLLITLSVFASCGDSNKPAIVKEETPEQKSVAQIKTNTNSFIGNRATEMDAAVISILQDKNGYYWFGTQNAGVYRYDGKNLIVFTKKDGLIQNQIQTIQEDASGNIWFGTGGFGVNCFDGEKIITPISKEKTHNPVEPEKIWKITTDDLWFYAGGGVYRYSDSSITYLSFPKPDFDNKYLPSPENRSSAYTVYTTLIDRNGQLWIGTQTMGVCRYDGKSFTWFTEKGLSGPAVLDIFEDSYGRIWFGNNGNGLFFYDGKTLTNLTAEKGLGNPEFLKSGKPKRGTLARVWAINEDNSGNLWIGTGDSGVWVYDGKNLVNYTEQNGLPEYPVETIYIDKQGQILLGTNGGGVFVFNGTSFEKFKI